MTYRLSPTPDGILKVPYMPILDDPKGRTDNRPLAADDRNVLARDDAARTWLAAQTLPGVPVMMGRGAVGRCPVCGEGRLFSGYLRLVERCASCAAPLGTVRADDAPPYFTIFITAHIIIALVVATGRDTVLPVWAMAALFLPLTLVIAMLLLRPIKGATVGAMLKLGLIGEHRENETR
jgi:uncharacterized protein (DUF983 family)